jgi:hypothetical protein
MAGFFEGLRFSDKTTEALYNLPHVGKGYEVSIAQNRLTGFRARSDFRSMYEGLRREILTTEQILGLMGQAATRALCLNTVETRGVDEYLADLHYGLLNEKLEADFAGRPLFMQAIFATAETRLANRHAIGDEYDGFVLTEGHPGQGKRLLDSTLTEAYANSLGGVSPDLPQLKQAEMPFLERSYRSVPE